MTAEELRARILAQFGYRGQSRAARALGISDRHMRRLLAGQSPIEDWVVIKLDALSGATKTHLTSDEWILGEGIDSDNARRYVIHTMHPRFIARAVEIDEETEEAVAPDNDVDPKSIVYRANEGLALAELHWIDPAPSGQDLTRMMEAACDALERWEVAQVGDDPDDDA